MNNETMMMIDDGLTGQPNTDWSVKLVKLIILETGTSPPLL